MSDKSRLENNNLTLQNITNTVMNMPNYIEIRNQNKTITQNGIYNADSGYTGLGTVTVNVSGGGGDVKQFDSIANMQADPNPTEGDLAIVYRNELEGITEDSEFSSCIFPNTVVLDEAFTGNVSERFRQVDDGYFDGIINVSSTAVIFQGYGESSEIRVEYTSQNGITYTRTDGGEELQEFGTTIKWYNMGGPFNSIIGNFMKIGGNYFEGLYQYSNNSYSLASTQFTADNRYVFNKSFYGVNGVDIGTLQNVENLTLDEVRLKAQVFSDLSYLTPSNNVTNMEAMFYYWKNLTIIPNIDTSNVTSMSEMFRECANLANVPEFNTSKVRDMSCMFLNCNNLMNVPNFDTSKVINMNYMFRGCTNLTDVPNFDTSNVTDMSCMFLNCNNLMNVPNFSTFNVTRMLGMFRECSNLMNVPNLDTSNVINMANMFYNCDNLTSVPNFNTSNVINMANMFYNCNNLTTVPNFDTFNVTNMYQMFSYCNNLSNESIQNIVNMCINSNVTNTTYKNLSNTNSYSIFSMSTINNSYYQNRWAELDAAGWTY